tara:strand:+ start:95 stop:421 length:327 start_codon:yes stop_codon:yes gene_type:complete
MKLEIYKKNNFFHDLYELMNNDIFKKFYNKYFNNWIDINTTIMYFKTYETLEYLFYCKYKRQIQKDEMDFLLEKIFKNKYSRQLALEKYNIYKTTCDKYLNYTNLLNN